MEENRVEEPIKIIDQAEKAEVVIENQENGEENPTPKKNLMREVLSYVFIILLAYLVASVVSNYIVTPVTVDGNSMEPTLSNNDWLILWRLGDLEAFDVVVFQPPKDNIDPDKLYIKRLIGLPGDYVEYKDGIVYINDEAIDEPYLKGNASSINKTLEEMCAIREETNCWFDNRYQIPAGYYLVLGDNRSNSEDSRSFGLVEESRFQGKAIFRLRGGFGRVK